MSAQFYRAFEDRHRGCRELIRERQQAYVPFLKPLTRMYPECPALDLGCGRGEWLEILLQNGFKPLGVDMDSGMLEACHALGLPVERGDALSALKRLPDESQTLVSGFHIAEHIPFQDLQILVDEALRVLKPAGLLILETPNAENVVVGTQNFYLDPTHERPIPHLLLSFLTEYAGFKRSKLIRLHEPSVLRGTGSVDLMAVLGGASPDYAIVAQKAASAEQLGAFDEAFDKEYGLALDILAQRYDSGHQERSLRAETHLQELVQRNAHNESRLNALQDSHHTLRDQIADLNARLSEAVSTGHSWQLRAADSEARVNLLLNSTSWRMTWPLRNAAISARWLIRFSVRVIKFTLRPVAARSIRFVLDRPALCLRVSRMTKLHPALFGRIKAFAIHRGIIEPEFSGPQAEWDKDDITPSSVKVLAVYTALKKAFEDKERG